MMVLSDTYTSIYAIMQLLTKLIVLLTNSIIVEKIKITTTYNENFLNTCTKSKTRCIVFAPKYIGRSNSYNICVLLLSLHLFACL